MKKVYEQFLQKAQNDLLNIENNFASKEIPADTCCFHAQQAAEKMLKAYLDYKNEEIPRTHNLPELLKLCNQHNPGYEMLKENLILLNRFSVSPRYPDEILEPTLSDALQAYELAKEVKQFITDNFFK